ncbi:flavin monoamine oxidase family protein [Thermoflavifilum thermophilum]|uniref:Tryptophan 2-monooxygenase n=1 Tax=Thermoflavifilum thermophilum TaxID=1393122 RepID=A0A1I7NN80_9BACT|nr:NAD(P)/FAD-dependent oxidoreductase [Thermoflavifilum thermophilum]SFV36111.1 monoamine oxidase [Thermoflavifilum thermophilum]
MGISTKWDTLIVGAGAAGLQCGVTLAEAGQKVLILEARNRAGGRIHTFIDKHTGYTLDAGAEFIHGQLPHTFEWVKKLRLPVSAVTGKNIRLLSDVSTTPPAQEAAWKKFHEILSRLRQDTTLDSFLHTYFPEESYSDFRREVLRFAMGYDAADPTRVSMLALRDEWEREEGPNYRIDKAPHLQASGYGAMIDGMIGRFQQAGGKWLVAHTVRLISLSTPAFVQVKAHFRQKILTYTADRVVITLPPGIFQKYGPKSISIEPGAKSIIQVMQRLGYGTATKIITLWKHPWWRSRFGPDMGFLISQAPVPTWWTAYPNDWPILTGWKGGPHPLGNSTPVIQKDTVIQSLVQVSGIPAKILQKEMLKCFIFDWYLDPFACGSYSYPVLGFQTLIQQLQAFFPQRLYFAGEAYHNRPPWGTVESALCSGQEVAEAILELHGLHKI